MRAGALKSPRLGSGFPSHSSHSWPRRRSVSIWMSCARGGAGGAGAAVGVMAKGGASPPVLGTSSLHIVTATPALLADDRRRAAYSEGAGSYRTLPRAVAVPG